MSDLISRSELIKTYCEENCGERKCVDAMDRCIFISHVLEQPTVEAKPVVHCRDCDLLQDCKIAQYLGLEGYCSNAEKKVE